MILSFPRYKRNFSLYSVLSRNFLKLSNMYWLIGRLNANLLLSRKKHCSRLKIGTMTIYAISQLHISWACLCTKRVIRQWKFHLKMAINWKFFYMYLCLKWLVGIRTAFRVLYKSFRTLKDFQLIIIFKWNSQFLRRLEK